MIRELRLELSITENSAWNLRYPQFFPAPPRGLQSEGEPSWYYYLAEIALRRLGNRILAHTSHFKSADTAISEKVSRIQDFEQQAESWYVPPAGLHPSTPHTDHERMPGSRLYPQTSDSTSH